MTALLGGWVGLPFFEEQVRGKEWSAACPRCGDSGHVGRDTPDRFRMWIDDPGPRGWCRICGYFAFVEDGGRKLSAARIEELERQRRLLHLRDQARKNQKIERLTEKAYWRGYHDAMNDAARQLWRDVGIPDSQQDWWELGFNPSYKTDDFESPAMTIPFFHEGQFVNMQSRLLNPPKPKDKYRFVKDLDPPLYLPERDALPGSGNCLIVEGAKKAMVMYLHLGHLIPNIIGLPNKHFREDYLPFIENCEVIWIMLDPDASEQAVSACKQIGTRARMVTIPAKPDDLIVKYKATSADVWRYIQHARSVS